MNKKIRDYTLTTLATFIMLIWILPLIWSVFVSLKSEIEVLAYPPNIFFEPTLNNFKDAIFGNSLSYTLKGSKYNREGNATAPLVGGNLTVLHTMLGSKTSIDVSGKILFIEEIGEYEYHIDRMLQSLKRAGYFDNCKGVIVGDITKVRKNTTAWGKPVEQLIIDALAEYNFPIAFNMPAGHEKDNRAMIFGRTVELKVGKDNSTLNFNNNK